jgi:S1-C subfamily serine protease
MSDTLAAFSASVSRLVASAASLVSAIRVGAAGHIAGLICEGDTIITIEQALPVQDRYLVAMSNRLPVVALPGPRDPVLNLAVLRLETPWPAVNPEIAAPLVGGLAIVVGADEEASPTVRLTVIHRFIRTSDGSVPVLDLIAEQVDPGSSVLDVDGRLIGLVAAGPSGEAIAIPGAMIGRMLLAKPGVSVSALVPAPRSAPVVSRRGWLGVALQPITVPEQLVARAGQSSGRMVVSITKGGPAELAGMRIGDVLLALDGTSASGPHALRAFLGGDRVGTTVEVRLLRDGAVLATRLTIALQPV